MFLYFSSLFYILLFFTSSWGLIIGVYTKSFYSGVLYAWIQKRSINYDKFRKLLGTTFLLIGCYGYRKWKDLSTQPCPPSTNLPSLLM